ncbi:AAA family ATPase [Xanthobacteraceae bacterium Astr-EGSB]|uniref:ATP-dependent nuclease n=1 Tax=Astrobacterium formosum TaxID=3069710 RepID=UPI0027B0C0F5|nr:AAA family ATPase [Xanthobacteraceae bacterium Astr-EGSB]
MIGPGDSFKSTVLSAISLLLAPYPLGPCSEFDYRQRRISDGFEIEAYIGNLDLQALGTEQRLPNLFGWRQNAPTPLPEGEAEPVLRCRVRGNADLELIYELPIENDEQPPPFSPALRRKLMLARLAGEERAARDLRLGTGSLLDRHLKTADMRASVHNTIAAATESMAVPTSAEAALNKIRESFHLAGAPFDLHLGLVPTMGNALVGMVALMSGPKVTEAIPIVNAGTGTKQIALLTLSAALAGSAPILVIDEPERGLEPYRQRSVTKKLTQLAGGQGQVFLTTHAPAILASLPAGSVWRMRPGQEPARFEGTPLETLLARDPDAFFAPMPILCEGATEIGVLDEMLPALLASDLNAHGVHLVDGEGQPNVLDIADAFIAAGMNFAAFLDNEPSYSGRRRVIASRAIAWIWQDAINIEDAVSKLLLRDALFALIPAAAQVRDIDDRHLEDQVFQKIPASEQIGSARDIRTAVYSDATLRAAFYSAMTKHSWFKSREGGRALARTLKRVGMPASIQSRVDEFACKLRGAIQ